MKFPGWKGASFPVESDEVSRLERSMFSEEKGASFPVKICANYNILRTFCF